MKKSTIEALKSHISAPRFQTFLDLAGGDPILALDLYQWNIRASGAVIASTGMVEVQLRNSFDQALRQWNSLQRHPRTGYRYGANWIDEPASPLRDIINPAGRKTLRERAEDALKDIDGQPLKPNPNHDDLIAGLTFGTWRWLLPQPRVTSPRNDRLRIWNQALAPCFVSANGGVPRNVVYGWVNFLWFYRNRASHLEPFIDPQVLISVHRTSARLLHSMNPSAAAWFAGQQFLPLIHRQFPLQ